LTTAERDIDQAIRQLTNDRITGDRLRRENAGLYQLVHGHWLIIQSESGDLNRFNERFRDLINDRLPDVWAYANGDLLREHAKLRRDIGESLARTSAQACITYFRDGNRQLLPQQRERDEELKAKAILGIDADRPLNQEAHTTVTYRIPGEVIGQLRRKTGLDASSLGNALDFKGDELTQCKVQLAMLDVLLDQPPAASTRILRDMMS
jgi:hypothetical protein